jgi:hypothetical protein
MGFFSFTPGILHLYKILMTSLRYRWKHQEIERPHIKNSSHKSSCNGGTHPARHTGTDVSDCQIDAYVKPEHQTNDLIKCRTLAAVFPKWI